MRKRWLDVAALLALVLLVLAFFWPLFSGRYHVPRGGGDLASFLWPSWRFAARSLCEGVLPLWNPTLFAGMPFAADNQSALFYPINLLVFLCFGEPSYRMMEGLVVLHMALAAALMFLLLRDKGLGRAAAVFGGLAFGLSDVFITHIGNLNLNATIAYLPGIILLAERAFCRRSLGWAAGAGALLAVSALAGHGQMLLVLGMALGALALCRAALLWQRGVRPVLGVLGLAAAMAAVGLAAAAVALYPAYELTRHSLRAGGLALEEASRYALPLRGLAGLVAPGFYGRGAHAFWGGWERVEVGYVGILPLVLGAASLVPQGKDEGAGQRFPRAFFAGLGLAGLVLAFGARTPAFRLAHALPLVRNLRAPARLIALTGFGLAALGAYGLDRLPRSQRMRIGTLAGLLLALAFALVLGRVVAVPPERLAAARRGAWLAAGLGVLGLLWLLAAWCRPKCLSERPAGRAPKPSERPEGGTSWAQTGGVGAASAAVGTGSSACWVGVTAVLLLATDLIASGSTVEIDRGDPQAGYQHHDVVAWLQNEPGPYRLDSSAAHSWQPNAAAVYGLYDISGVANPLGLAAYETYRWSIGGRGDTLHSLLGARYTLADKGNPPGDQRLVPVYTGGPAVDIYENTNAYPMAQLLYRAVRVEGAGEAFEAIHASGFDPAQTLVLQEDPLPLPDPAGEAGYVEWVEYEANRLTLRVQTPAPAYLLLSEVYYPGWRASIDGDEARVLVADYLFRAVYIPRGAHEVRLWFSPPSFWLGLALSLATWLGLAAWGAIAWVRRAWPDPRASRLGHSRVTCTASTPPRRSPKASSASR